jgi:hypothetical protein
MVVRRGSTVRVRQRALQKPANRRFLFCANLHDLQRAMGMEPFMDPSDSERALEASEMDASAGKIVGWRQADMSRTGSIRPSSLAIRRRRHACSNSCSTRSLMYAARRRALVRLEPSRLAAAGSDRPHAGSTVFTMTQFFSPLGRS